MDTCIKSFYIFNKTHKRYDHSPLLHLDRYGYVEVGCFEYYQSSDPRPKIIAEEFAIQRKYEDLVYRMTHHTDGQPWITLYAKYK